ncbi:filamentous hemagglutinin N-terminal domain-containing protein [Candidatus Albibeggiatoa sp. nov. NOAA]|uniref:two-partner secretion domain-containing protein n=1 Tax=Candidatus Albibeggiatoa sp. nov. NOAA TaxID=3162724 RepID=UPI003301F5A4|nr:filamentous hemagglutinin N-terminal domain-containing protein [Thiotrichaceae bacterium]
MRGFLFLLVYLTNIAQAEISINQLPMIDGVYNIPQELGQTVGSNLFHSFDSFNLNAGETAQFIGSGQIQNVISRVTGNEPSLINGTIRSLMPNADFYFLNPNGIVFGESAQLQVPNSFHASTSDYVKLSDGGEFHARFPEQDILTTAPISAFGFLDNATASIQINNAQLAVAPTKTLSLIGGDITLNNTQLTAPSGRINFSSIAQADEVEAITFTSNVQKQGSINILDASNIEVSGLVAGAIVVNGGSFLLKESFLRANAYGDFDGLGIYLNLTESINILQTYVVDNEMFAVTNQNFGGGSVTGINIQTPQLSLYRGGISATNFGTGQGGHINIETGKMLLDLGASVVAGSIGNGDSGHINITAQQSLSLLGQNTGHFEVAGFTFIDFPSFIASDAYSIGANGNINITTGHLELQGGYIGSNHDSIGSAGSDITINANSMSVTDGGIISTAVFEQPTQDGGSLTLNVKGTLTISGKREGISTDIFNRPINNPATVIGTGTYGNNASAGFFSINADTLIIKDEAFVSASTARLGNAGTIEVSARHIHISNNGLLSVSSGAIQNGYLHIGGGKGGNLKVQADTITLESGGGITANSFGTGQAGDLSISANQLNLINNGNILTSAANASGGNISLNISNLLHLQQSEITTSVHGGAGDGGNIDIVEPQFTVLNKGTITAQADAGQGGNIRIVANQFLKDPISIVSASSRLGIDGNIEITSPDETVSTGLLHLNKSFAEQAQIKDACKAAIAGQLPTEFQPPLTFKVNMYRFSNHFIEDWIPSAISSLRLPTCQ